MAADAPAVVLIDRALIRALLLRAPTGTGCDVTRTVITLRARLCGTPPRPGELMATETGGTVVALGWPRAAPDGPARRRDATGGRQSPDASTR